MNLRPHILAAATLIALSLTSCAAATETSSRPLRFTAPIHATVDYAVDGDTLRVRLSSGELDYVRLIGMLSRVSRPTLRLPAVAGE